MADRSGGFFARLIDWFTIEVPGEASGSRTGPGGGPARVDDGRAPGPVVAAGEGLWAEGGDGVLAPEEGALAAGAGLWAEGGDDFLAPEEGAVAAGEGLWAEGVDDVLAPGEGAVAAGEGLWAADGDDVLAPEEGVAAARRPGVLERLVAWFTVEITEDAPGSRQAEPAAGTGGRARGRTPAARSMGGARGRTPAARSMGAAGAVAGRGGTSPRPAAGARRDRSAAAAADPRAAWAAAAAAELGDAGGRPSGGDAAAAEPAPEAAPSPATADDRGAAASAGSVERSPAAGLPAAGGELAAAAAAAAEPPAAAAAAAAAGSAVELPRPAAMSEPAAVPAQQPAAAAAAVSSAGVPEAPAPAVPPLPPPASAPQGSAAGWTETAAAAEPAVTARQGAARAPSWQALWAPIAGRARSHVNRTRAQLAAQGSVALRRGRARIAAATAEALENFRRWPGAPAAVTMFVAALLVIVVGARVAGHLTPSPRLQPAGPPIPTAAAIAIGQAQTVAASAEAAAQQAQSAAHTVTDLLTSAQSLAAQVASLATPALARQPSAQDPARPLAALQQDQAQAASAVASIRGNIAPTVDAAASAAKVAAKVSSAGPAASNAAAAASAVKAALATAQGAASRIAALLPPAQDEATAWQQVHTAPPGSLGVAVQDPPASWGVQGCEVRTVQPGSAGSQLGLTGATSGGNPVGDIITQIEDATDGSANWPVHDCGDMQAAMAQTRAGDQITVSYEHRASLDQIIGIWLAHTGTVVLGQGNTAQSVCPAPIHGTGYPIKLTVALGGPAGTRKGVPVSLDPSGAATSFPDALLRALGYRPYQSRAGSGIVPGSKATVYLYDVPGSALTVLDGGKPVALADGVLKVVGIPGATASVLGPDVLAQGAHFATSGSSWTLTPPCH